jgi:hypothetical protein
MTHGGRLATTLVALAGACTAGLEGDDEPDPPELREPGDGGGGGGLGGSVRSPPAPGAPPPDAPPPGAPVPGAPVLFSEIMYHPVGEDGPEETHEFLEIHNRTDAAVALAGWRLTGAGVTFTFPPGATIGARRYLVVAKNRDALLAIKTYALAPADVIGSYAGQLDNGGGRLALVDAQGAVVDQAGYDDELPWPLAADAFGAGDAWLGPPLAPLVGHRYMGCSLERLSFDVPATEVANWDASDVDGATPGRPNPRAGDPPAIIEQQHAAPEGATGMIREGTRTLIRAKPSARGALSRLQVRYFVDVLDRDDEAVVTAPMARDADGWAATLPGRPANTLVRYQLWGDRGQGLVQLSPRPSDPYRSHAYFVSPAIATPARVYHLFVDTAKMEQMWKNSVPDAGIRYRELSDRCTLNPKWNEEVGPATFVHDGKVYDVRVRYSGSNYNRINGLPLAAFAPPRPANPAPFRVLSWKIKFPRYRDFEGRRGIKLNKLNQACPGVTELVGGSLFRAAGIPDSDPRWARVYLNGGYYHYMMEVEEKREQWIARNQPKGAAMGDLFKADGVSAEGESGHWGLTNFAPLADSARCPAIKAPERYRFSYPRKSNPWKTGSEVKDLIEAHAAAKAAGPAALKAFLEKTFDVGQVLTYIAIRNWSGPVDVTVHGVDIGCSIEKLDMAGMVA